MKNKSLLWASWMALGVAAVVHAQTVMGSGTTDSVPVFTGTSTVGNSPISVSGNNVGIGTTNPIYSLHVNGEIFANSGFRVGSTSGDDLNGAPWYGLGLANSSLSLWNGYHDAVQVAGYWGLNFQTGNGEMVIRGDSGNVAVGTITPGQHRQLVFKTLGTNDYTYIGQHQMQFAIGNGLGPNSNYELEMGILDNGTGIIQANASGVGYEPLALNPVSGNVGIGTTSPGAKLEVAGNIKLTNGSGASMTFADGTTQTTAWTGTVCGGDYAEAMNVAGGKAQYEAGDVLALSADGASDVQKTTEPYSTMVSGIYATKPGVAGQRESIAKSNSSIPMAMVGVVPTKVSAENGPIHRGDLLVSSLTPGFAMRGTDRGRMLGAVIGKAMGTLDSGTGVIEVLVTLQ